MAGSGTQARDTSGGGAALLVAEARRGLFVMVAFLALLWAVQLANWSGHYALDREYGLVPGDLTRLPDILTAPLLHGSWSHIESNSGPLFVFGFLAAYRGVARFLGLTALVAVVSGLTVWVFESGDHYTVGASGLVFGYFGYVVVRGLFDRNLVDSLIGVVMAASFAYMLTVAVPGAPGISWLAHLGGLAGGLVGAWLFRDRRRSRERKAAAAPAMAGGAGQPSAPAVQGAPDGHPRGDLHQELKDLGLL
ncbi:rhomboid family intramembrane serine protease [Streptomyces sp. NPDC059740]|uniref:rhomboid family intramembrane serine protease n=1 Tax=Streptomyces sp. NPDC059740 TaxID=3346926 RepID=UPI0036682A04